MSETPQVNETKTAAMRSLGISGLQQFGGIVHEEWHKKLQGRNAAEKFREMKDNNATIGAVLFIIESLIMRAPWKFKASKQNDKTSEEWAEFANQNMGDMSHTWAEMLTDALSMLPFGHAPMEITYKKRKGKHNDPLRTSKYDDGKLGWAAIELRAQDTIQNWEFDDHGNVLGFWQCAPPKYVLTFIPAWKYINFRTRSSKNNPEGRSLLRNCYQAYYFLTRHQEIEAVGVERDLNGIPDIQVPPNYFAAAVGSDEWAILQDMKRQGMLVRQDRQACVVRPSVKLNGVETGFDFGLLSAGNNRKVETRPIIEGYKRDVATVMLAQFLLLGSTATGSYALSDSQKSSLGLAIYAILDIMAEAFNRTATRQLMELNGVPEDMWPTLDHGDVDAPSLAEIADAIYKLVKVGVITGDDELEAHLRQKGGLPLRNPDTARKLPGTEGQGEGDGDVTPDRGGGTNTQSAANAKAAA